MEADSNIKVSLSQSDIRELDVITNSNSVIGKCGGERSLEEKKDFFQHKDAVRVEIEQKKLLHDVNQVVVDVDRGDVKNKQKNWLVFEIFSQLVDICKEWYSQNRIICLFVATCLVFGGVTAYMAAALIINFERALPLLVIWCCLVGFKLYAFVCNIFGRKISSFFQSEVEIIKKNTFWLKWVFVSLFVIGLLVWIALDTLKRPNQLISGAGYLIFLFCLFLSSTHPSKVKWKTVLWGLFIQICFALVILRTTAGFKAFNWFGELVQTFMNFTDAGIIFVFGKGYAEHYFAFKVLPIVIFFSAFVSVMYYFGVVQWILHRLAWLMQISLGTSATETMVAAGNIFISQTEAPLLIKPFIEDLTSSELFAVMVCGFATVAGSTLGAYLSFGIDAVYLITACVMSSPCALAVAKLVMPETQQSKFMTTRGLTLDGGDARNMFDAAAQGASTAIFLTLNIGGNLIVFLSLLALSNAILSWFGSLVDFPQFSFEFICSYVFVPVTFLMGIEWEDCFKSAELLGVGTFLNEFIAYDSLAELIKARDSGIIPRVDPMSGSVNWISERSEAIMTYALCGFASVGSIGVMLGGLGSLAPSRRGDMANMIVKALLVATAVNVLNACVAGFLYEPKPIVCDNILATTNWNYSVPSRLYECCSAALRRDNSNVTCNCCNYNWNGTTFYLNCSMAIC